MKLSEKIIELWNTGGKPRYWTVLFFTSDIKDFPEQVAKVMGTDPENGGKRLCMQRMPQSGNFR